MIQSVNGEDLVHEFAVAGDDAEPQPVEQASVGDFEPQGKQSAVLLRFFQDRTDKAVQPLRTQVEGDQFRIVLFKDEFHCLHRFFPVRASSPEGEHDTQTHNNILLQTVKFNAKTERFFNNAVYGSTKYITIRARICGGHGEGRRLCPVCERVPDGALGGAAGWWCAVYRSMNLHYIHLPINNFLILFVIIRVVQGRKKITVREYSSCFRVIWSILFPNGNRRGSNHGIRGGTTLSTARRYEFRLAAEWKHTSPVSESSENSLFRGFCVFSERDCLCHNDLRGKEFNGICPKNHCELRHFRDSEKRLRVEFEPEPSDVGPEKNPDFFKNQGPFCTPAWQ